MAASRVANVKSAPLAYVRRRKKSDVTEGVLPMETIEDQLAGLTTPHLADGCLRTNVPIRFAPAGVRPLLDTMQCRGQARPVRHVGSIDVFLEAFERVQPGDVLVIDNGGRLDEACVGDIIVLEGQAAG